MTRIPVAAVAAVGLVVAFVVAQGSGVRVLGALVLLGTVAACLALAVPRAGWVRSLLVVPVGAAAFVASHLVAPAVGAWAAVLGATAWWLVDRARPRRGVLSAA